MNNRKLHITLLFIGIFCFIYKLFPDASLNISKKEAFYEISTFAKLKKVQPRSELFQSIGESIEEKYTLVFERFKNVEDPFKFIHENKVKEHYQDRFNQFYDLLKNQNQLKDITAQKASFAIFPTPTWKTYRLDSLDIPSPKSNLQIIAARGEWESSQLGISCLKKGLDSVICEISNWPFKEFPELFWGDYIYCDWSIEHQSEVTVQDLLIPFDEEKGKYRNKFIQTKIDSFQTKSVWLNCDFSDKQIVPGNYKAQLKVKGFHNGIISGHYELPIEIYISEKEIPEKRFLKTQFSYNYDWTHWYYNDSSYADSVIPNHYDFLEDYGIVPVFVFPTEFNEYPPISKWPELNKKGVETFILFFYYGDNKKNHFLFNPEFREKSVNWILEKEKILDSLNLLEFSYIFIDDEPAAHEADKIHRTAKMLKDAGVRSKLYTTSYFMPDKDLFDAWVPLLDVYRENENHFTSKTEPVFKEKWAYICNTTYKDGLGNFFTDIPAHLSRKAIWDLYESNIEYFQYYALNRWDKNLGYELNGNRKVHNIINKKGEVDWNPDTYRTQHGDGQFVYPGLNGELWPSVRLINLRDGLEDYELFKTENIKPNFELPFDSIIYLRKYLLK